MSPRDAPNLLVVTYHSHLFPAPGNHESTFVSMHLPTREFYRNGIIQYVFFCVWILSLNIMSSKFVHVAACVSTSFLSVAEQNSIVLIHYDLFIYLSMMEIWIVSTFWLSLIMLMWKFMVKFLCEHNVFNFLGVYLRIEWPDNVATLVFKEPPNCFSHWQHIFIFPLVMCEGCNFSITLSTVVMVCLFCL